MSEHGAISRMFFALNFLFAMNIACDLVMGNLDLSEVYFLLPATL